jgi:hypothetical protein
MTRAEKSCLIEGLVGVLFWEAFSAMHRETQLLTEAEAASAHGAAVSYSTGRGECDIFKVVSNLTEYYHPIYASYYPMV